MHTELRGKILAAQAKTLALPAPAPAVAARRRRAERKLTGKDIFRFEYFEQRKALNQRVNPTKAWGDINAAWAALPAQRKQSYTDEAAIGVTQSGRKRARDGAIAPPPLAVADQQGQLEGGTAPVAMSSMLAGDLGKCLATQSEVKQLGGDLAGAKASEFPLSARVLEASMANSQAGRASIVATAAEFDQVQTYTAKPRDDFPAELEYPRAAYGYWDEPFSSLAKHRASCVSHIRRPLAKNGSPTR